MKDREGVELRCHTFQGVHIPGCWGCAIYDHKRCTCGPRLATHEPAVMHTDPMERRIVALERKVSALIKLLEGAAK